MRITIESYILIKKKGLAVLFLSFLLGKYFYQTSGNRTLEIRNLTYGDNGTYVCYAQYVSGGNRASKKTDVNVVEAFKPKVKEKYKKIEVRKY